jgi:hypothetical protein
MKFIKMIVFKKKNFFSLKSYRQVIDGDIANQIKTQDDLIKNKQLIIDNIKAKNTSN